MKIQVIKIDSAYNHWGCGYRLLFLIIYNRKSWIRRNRNKSSIYLNRSLNKLVEYWNYHGSTNGRNMIIKKEMYVPIDTLGDAWKQEDCKAINIKHYGFLKEVG